MRVQPGPRGVLLPDARLALDVHAPGHECVVSHAHSDHLPFGAPRAHATPDTAALAGMRDPSIAFEAHPYGEPFRVGRATVTLHPAGHVLGSALVHVDFDGETLLYTGDVKLRWPLTCEPAAPVEAATLVTESTFGLPVFRFPSTEDLAGRVAAFARETLEAGDTPVLLGWTLGKSQEILKMLADAGVPAMAHGAAWALTERYRDAGYAFPGCKAYDRARLAGNALVAPPSARLAPMVTNLPRARVAYCSGWAAIENRRAQMDADALIPLSDHCDFPDLLRLVDAVRPSRVVALHGYADVFAHVVRKLRGIEATALAAGRGEEVE